MPSQNFWTSKSISWADPQKKKNENDVKMDENEIMLERKRFKDECG